jgi:hypothetical protein
MIQKVNFRLLILGLVILTTSCTNNYEEGIRNYKSENYENALLYLKRVDSSDKNYDSAEIKIAEIENILTQIQIEKQRQDSIAIVEKEKKEIGDFMAQLNREIESFKTFDGSKYRSEISSIQIEVALFATWANIIKKAESHSDKEIIRLGKTLKTKVINLQKTEFPRLRKAYGEILKGKLWAENIKVTTKGTGHTTLEFVGGLFASNKNKQDTQQTLSEMLHLLKFKRTNYKWYDYDDEYTYYSMETKADGELVNL